LKDGEDFFMRRTHDFKLFMWFFEKSSSVCSMAVLSDLIVSDGGSSATVVFVKIDVNAMQIIWKVELGNVEERVCIGAIARG
jgi:hypothetical protein